VIHYDRYPLARARQWIETILPAQWAETGDSELPCEPQWSFYEAIEKTGAGILLVCFDDDRPIGYVAGMVHANPNSRNTKMVTISTYYVENRKGRPVILRRMIEHAIEVGRRAGALRAIVDTEYDNSAGRIFEAMGAEPVKIGYRFDLTRTSLKEVVNA
jgi:hypothetical protein